MAAQAVAVRAVIAPQRLFKHFPTQYVGTLLHQDREQLQADRVEFEQAPFAGNFQGIEVVIKIGHLQGATTATLGTA